MAFSLKPRRSEATKIITIGTHRILERDCTETLWEKNKKIAAIVHPHLREVVCCNEECADIIFPLNTKAPEEVDIKEACKIRASIEKEAAQHKISIWWFMLRLILEDLACRLGRDVLSKDKCIHVSKSLGFSEAELIAALAFFDKCNIFLYKEKVLPGVIFTNSQVPLDKVSELVEKQHYLKAAEEDSSRAEDLGTTGD